MEERRKNNRIKLTSSLFIKRLDRDTQEKVEIEILDVSKSGVGFSCSKPLEIGAVYEYLDTGSAACLSGNRAN